MPALRPTPLKSPEKAKTLTKVKLDSDIIGNFVTTFLKKQFSDATETPECHKEWWDMCCSSHKYVAIAAPRGHGKSTAITLAYALASLVFRDRKFIVILSDTESQATFFLNNLKKELADNQELRDLFGIDKFLKDTETDVIVEFVDGYQARIVAKGAEQKLRGLNWNGTRPDLILGDDMENDEIVLNPDRREKFRRWWSGAVQPSLSKNGIIRLIGTILHMDSLLQRYMPNVWDKDVTVTNLKILSSYSRSYWWAAKYKAHPAINDFSEVLWPAYHTAQSLKSEYENKKAQGLSDIYAQEYLNEPIDDSNALMRKSDFRELKSEDDNQPVNWYIGMDLAVTTDSVKRDKSAFVVAGVDPQHVVQVRNVICERLDILDIVQQIMTLNRIYPMATFIVEKGMLANSILPLLKVAMFEENNFVNLILLPVVGQGDKVKRNSSIRARMRAGGVKFDKSADWFIPFEQECMQFPRAVHDDQVDALSNIGLCLDTLATAPTLEEIEQEQYEEDRRGSFLGDDGRSVYTGY